MKKELRINNGTILRNVQHMLAYKYLSVFQWSFSVPSGGP